MTVHAHGLSEHAPKRVRVRDSHSNRRPGNPTLFRERDAPRNVG